MKSSEIKLQLQLFAEGGDGSSAGAGTAAAQAGVSPESPAPGNERQKRAALAQIRYGKQKPDSQAQAAQGQDGQQAQQAQAADGQTQPQTEEPESFDELIRGRYKQDFDSKVQAIVQDRLKNAKQAQQQLDKLTPALQMLAKQYGMDASDLQNLDADAFAAKVLQDRKFYEEEAAEKGVSVETVMQMRRMELENERLRKMEREGLQEQKRREEFQKLVGQFDAVKQVYPQAELQQELQNPAFGRLVANGVDARTAYEVVHRDEIQRGAMQYAVQRSQEKLSASVQANSRRPVENGNAGAPGVVTKEDPRTWTREDREEIKRRVLRGEQIYL